MSKDCNGNKVKAGDKVVRITTGYDGTVLGGTYVVSKVLASDTITLEGLSGGLLSGNFVLVPSPPMPEKVRDPYPHAEVAKAWLDGYPVEGWDELKWIPYCPDANPNYVPAFHPKKKYRIKPVDSKKEKQIKELVRQAEELLAKAKMLEQSK